jgi:hypothetical protein
MEAMVSIIPQGAVFMLSAQKAVTTCLERPSPNDIYIGGSIANNKNFNM